METTKISAIATEATVLTGAEKYEILQAGATKYVTQETVLSESDNHLKLIKTLGSPALAFTLNPMLIQQTQTLVDTREYMVPIYLPKAATLTGVKFVQVTQGNYTADQNNRIGLYSVAAGVLTLVAECVNDGDFWKSAPGVITKAFATPYAAAAGVYYIGFLYNNSAQTTAPGIGATLTMSANVSALDLANSNKLSSYFESKTDLVPSTTALSAASVAGQIPFFMLY
jgi:hypothetical protein